jgi:hypothetical protein
MERFQNKELNIRTHLRRSSHLGEPCGDVAEEPFAM